MNLYLIDRELSCTAKAIVGGDGDAVVALIQDGVYVDVSDIKESTAVYALAEDVKKRGLDSAVKERVKRISYDELVDLIVEHRIHNFA